MHEQRVFGQTRSPEERITLGKNRLEDGVYQSRQDALIEQYGPGLGVAVFDFGLYPNSERIRVLAEQVVIKSDEGSQEDRVLALQALLEAIVLRNKVEKFGRI